MQANMFDQIVGNSKALELLQADLKNNNLAHGYLFCGPADCGKMTIAIEFAKALQTASLAPEEAEKIAGLIVKGAHMDTTIGRIGTEATWKIEPVRQLLDNLNMSGTATFRVLVMEDIDKLTLEAANAMLKMLEEPPHKVKFIFTSSQPQAVLETIHSRLRKIEFTLLTPSEMLSTLSNRFRIVDKTKLERVTKLAQGRIALALKLLTNDDMLEAYNNIFVQIEEFLKAKRLTPAFSLISQIHTDPLLVNIFIDIVTIFLREYLLTSATAKEQENYLLALDKLFKIKRLNETNANSRLLLEQFMISL